MEINDITIVAPLGRLTVRVRLLDLDATDWSEIRKQTGYRPKEVLSSLDELDVSALAALIWVWRRKENPKLSFANISKQISLATFQHVDIEGLEDDEDEDDDEDPLSETSTPKRGDDSTSSESSPTGATSTESDPGN